MRGNMKINEVEQAAGITKKNIRFYEEEGLLNPSRSANGYRDYSPEDVEILRQIRLLRRLDISLEEIKRLQSNDLTLDDCLKRHLIVLERRAKNLETVTAFCRRLLAENASLSNLPVEQLLLEMDNMEEGGTKFVDIKRKDKRVRKMGAFISAMPFIALMALFMTSITVGFFTDPSFSLTAYVITMTIPALFIISLLYALWEKFKEIKGGEFDEASKY